MTEFKMLDCFCGMGGVSDGFALEGFDVTGIDIVDAPKMLGYKHRFIQANMLTLRGEDFQGYDVIWGSPPCRDFTQLGIVYGKSWKKKRNPENGLKLVNAFLGFVKIAEPKIWIMENVAYSKRYIPLKPTAILKIQRQKTHCFWGNFPAFLLPRTNSVIRGKTSTGRDTPIWKNRKLATWLSAKIPLVCARAFARGCREQLEARLLVNMSGLDVLQKGSSLRKTFSRKRNGVKEMNRIPNLQLESNCWWTRLVCLHKTNLKR